MPIFFQQDIDENTKLAIWKIEEDENFFLHSVPLQREITHPHKRLQHLAGRYLLKYLFPDFPVELIRIADTRKPFLENEIYHFSISHCGNYAAVIVSKAERVGVDIEMPTTKVEKIKHKFLHEKELAMLASERSIADNNFFSNHQSSSICHLTLLWSCKEAVFKWWSYGKVDFSEQIRLQSFELQPSGYLHAQFIAGEQFNLMLHYRLFEPLCLAWVKTP
ncbi:MAG: 4'-phosphopantetheinyl transferase family protein [Flavisolibacter sp.]